MTFIFDAANGSSEPTMLDAAEQTNDRYRKLEGRSAVKRLNKNGGDEGTARFTRSCSRDGLKTIFRQYLSLKMPKNSDAALLENVPRYLSKACQVQQGS